MTDYYLPDAYLALAILAALMFHLLTGLCPPRKPPSDT